MSKYLETFVGGFIGAFAAVVLIWLLGGVR